MTPRLPACAAPPQSPRQNTGLGGSQLGDDPALELVKALYGYSRRFHGGRTAIVATGLRSRQGKAGVQGSRSLAGNCLECIMAIPKTRSRFNCTGFTWVGQTGVLPCSPASSKWFWEWWSVCRLDGTLYGRHQAAACGNPRFLASRPRILGHVAVKYGHNAHVPYGCPGGLRGRQGLVECLDLPWSDTHAVACHPRADALALAGCDYLVLPGKVMGALAAEATDQGYNDGLSAVSGGQGVQAVLSPAAAEAMDLEKVGPVVLTREGRAELGLALG